MVGNETTLHQRPNGIELNYYRSPFVYLKYPFKNKIIQPL